MAKIKGRLAKTYDTFIKRPTLLPAGLLELVKSLDVKSVCDFGCGTGNIAVGLSLEGYDITGVDYSPDMLKVARNKAREYKADVKFILGDIGKIDLGVQFDLILCLGNTIPHFIVRKDLERFLKNCKRHLRPGGYVIFQQLNYDRMLKEGSGTFAIETSGEIIRIKQSHFGKGTADFFVTIVDTAIIPPKISSTRVKIHPWIRSELFTSLKQAGFGKVMAYGDYDREKFNLKSKDLILMANT